MSIRGFYDRWPQYNGRLSETVAALSPEQLAIRHGPDDWPIWATVAHNAGARAYWVCGVLKEPGAEETPFTEPLTGLGWEDDLDHPRSPEELAWALDSTFAVVDRLLDAWTPGMLEDEIERWYGDVRQIHSRASILQRLLTHDAWHAAQVSDALVATGHPGIDLWRQD
jgi:uncharacterized damage-inducible protein DinB